MEKNTQYWKMKKILKFKNDVTWLPVISTMAQILEQPLDHVSKRWNHLDPSNGKMFSHTFRFDFR